MKITTLIENSLGNNKTLINEHGLSIFIETDFGNILFDTGQSGDFVKNAKKLNVDLNSIKYLVLSHGHYDHCGGVKRLLQSIDSKPNLYVSKYFFKNSYKYHLKNTNKLDKEENYKYIGIDFSKYDLIDNDITINYISSNSLKLTPNVTIHTNFKRNCNFEKLNPTLKFKSNNLMMVDEFLDEIALTIDTPRGLLVIVGCSHIGIINIINSIKERSNKKIYGIIGGTHLVEANDDRIDKTIEYFSKLGIDFIGVSHCTGKHAIEKLQNNCNKFFLNCTGTILNID